MSNSFSLICFTICIRIVHAVARLLSWLKGALPGTLPKQLRAKKKNPICEHLFSWPSLQKHLPVLSMSTMWCRGWTWWSHLLQLRATPSASWWPPGSPRFRQGVSPGAPNALLNVCAVRGPHELHVCMDCEHTMVEILGRAWMMSMNAIHEWWTKIGSTLVGTHLRSQSTASFVVGHHADFHSHPAWFCCFCFSWAPCTPPTSLSWM